MLAGVFLFHELFPFLSSFYDSTPLGQVTLPSALGISFGVATFGLVAMGLAAFIVAGRFEAARARRQ